MPRSIKPGTADFDAFSQKTFVVGMTVVIVGAGVGLLAMGPENAERGVAALLVLLSSILVASSYPIIAVGVLPIVLTVGTLWVFAGKVACNGCAGSSVPHMIGLAGAMAGIGLASWCLLAKARVAWIGWACAALLAAQSLVIVFQPQFCQGCVTVGASMAVASIWNLGQRHLSPVLAETRVWRLVHIGGLACFLTGVMLSVTGKMPNWQYSPPLSDSKLLGQRIERFTNTYTEEGWFYVSQPGCSACDAAKAWVTQQQAPVAVYQPCRGGEREPCWEMANNPVPTPTLVHVKAGRIAEVVRGFSPESWRAAMSR